MDENKGGNSRIVNWFNGLKSEFQKITWLDRVSVGKQTLAVIIVTVILAVIIAVLDFGIQHGVELLTRL